MVCLCAWGWKIDQRMNISNDFRIIFLNIVWKTIKKKFYFAVVAFKNVSMEFYDC
jgi:hypothetical protein